MNLKIDTSIIKSQLKTIKRHFWSKQKEEVESQERVAVGAGVITEAPIQFKTTKMDNQDEILQETASSSANLIRQSDDENQITNNEKYFCINKKSIVVGILFFINLLNYVDRFTVAGMLNN